MKLVCASFGLEMELLENYVTVLVVENAGYLTEIVSSLKKQSEGEEGIFVLAENDKIEKIDKKLALVIDPFSIMLLYFWINLCLLVHLQIWFMIWIIIGWSCLKDLMFVLKKWQ